MLCTILPKSQNCKKKYPCDLFREVGSHHILYIFYLSWLLAQPPGRWESWPAEIGFPPQPASHLRQSPPAVWSQRVTSSPAPAANQPRSRPPPKTDSTWKTCSCYGEKPFRSTLQRSNVERFSETCIVCRPSYGLNVHRFTDCHRCGRFKYEHRCGLCFPPSA